MVENVSEKLVDLSDINDHKLSPCKICKPPAKASIQNVRSKKNKAVGSAESVRCKGKTLKGRRCKHRTRLADGYCYQHGGEVVKIARPIACGAKNKSGGYCKRKVKGGGRCYQH